MTSPLACEAPGADNANRRLSVVGSRGSVSVLIQSLSSTVRTVVAVFVSALMLLTAEIVHAQPVTFIHDIQGNGASSPIVGSSVTIRGIVTGVKSDGFFVQEEDADVDADPMTSEGIFVFTSGAPPAAAAFTARVEVTGTVAEFVPCWRSAGPAVHASSSRRRSCSLLPPGQHTSDRDSALAHVPRSRRPVRPVGESRAHAGQRERRSP